jgi:hypothetical protein
MMEEKMAEVEILIADQKSPEFGLILARKVAELAAMRYHRLAARMVDGEHPLTLGQADGIMRHLSGCPVRPTPEENMARHDAYRLDAEHERHMAGAVIADIAAGFYATQSATGNNDLDFWKVTEGRKPGMRFVKRVIGGGDTKYPRLVDISQQQQLAALRAILREGIEKASDQYAVNQERCKKCGSHLTDDDSRAARMGPVCRGER